MNHRLIWNFEINTINMPNLTKLTLAESDSIKWEARWFWQMDIIIELHGLSAGMLDLSQYTTKHRHDRYYLIPKFNFNIKLRDDELLYKPLDSDEGNCQAFGKKINLATFPKTDILPGVPSIRADELLKLIETKGQTIDVEKMSFSYQFPTEPAIKLELGRLVINNRPFFSACIEGRSQQLVNIIRNHLLKEQRSCDYVHFLQQLK